LLIIGAVGATRRAAAFRPKRISVKGKGRRQVIGLMTFDPALAGRVYLLAGS
jgi:hypothetical protein